MAISFSRIAGAIRWARQEPAKEKRPYYSATVRTIRALTASYRSVAEYRRAVKATEHLPAYNFIPTPFESSLPFRLKSIWLYISYSPFFLAASFFARDQQTFIQA